MGSCAASYMGRTYRHFKVVVSEHQGVSPRTGKPVKVTLLLVTLSVRDHMLVCDHKVVYEDFKFLGNESNRYLFELKESLFIKRDKHIFSLYFYCRSFSNFESSLILQFFKRYETTKINAFMYDPYHPVKPHFSQKRLQSRCCLGKFSKILRAPILKNTCEQPQCLRKISPLLVLGKPMLDGKRHNWANKRVWGVSQCSGRPTFIFLLNKIEFVPWPDIMLITYYIGKKSSFLLWR